MIDIIPSNTLSFQDNVTLTCFAGGGPGNVFQWKKNGVNVAEGSDSVLQLNFITATAGGEYTCLVHNAAGSNSISIALYVRPYFTVQPMSISTEGDQNINLTCESQAFPLPTIEWFRFDGEEFGVTVTQTNTSALMFTPVQFGDEGDYYCTATSNGESTNSTTATLTGTITACNCAS